MPHLDLLRLSEAEYNDSHVFRREPMIYLPEGPTLIPPVGHFWVTSEWCLWSAPTCVKFRSTLSRNIILRVHNYSATTYRLVMLLH
jgi:hypothetical protein